MDARFQEFFEAIHALIGHAEELENQVLSRHGIPLTPRQLADARLVGVRDPDRIRIANSFAALEADPRFASLLNFGLPLVGVTVGYAIILNASQAGSQDVFLHECAHVAQCERLGLQNFLRQYFSEIATFGYRAAPLEREADAAVRRITGGDRPARGGAL